MNNETDHGIPRFAFVFGWAIVLIGLLGTLGEHYWPRIQWYSAKPPVGAIVRLAPTTPLEAWDGTSASGIRTRSYGTVDFRNATNTSTFGGGGGGGWVPIMQGTPIPGGKCEPSSDVYIDTQSGAVFTCNKTWTIK